MHLGGALTPDIPLPSTRSGCGTAVTFSLNKQYNNAYLAGAEGTASPNPKIDSNEEIVSQLTESASWGVNTALAFGVGIACMACER